MSKKYKFDVMVQKPNSSAHRHDGVNSFVQTIEVESTQEALEALGSYKLVVVPSDQEG
jgi:hypothetical protein